ncbi:MAG: hypothetical protein FJ077_07750, partial [Cyanobacteria bacterium K_DeepCast_35m_m2_023]|nr:hypothetical protein [Cyanobacteria bacterium K_DeepCast_35m_m2_023]
MAVPLLLGGVWLGAGVEAAQAQVTGQGPGGLNTAVNGVVGGSCGSGLCQVSGGTVGGNNLFHRFSSFDTRGAVTGVQIQNGGLPHVVVGVTAPQGSFIDKPVSLSTPGSLYWLSPGGIAVEGAGGFVNTTELTLSTATSQRIGEGRFDVFGTTPQQAALLRGRPGTAAADLVLDPAVRAVMGLAPDPEIRLNGVQLTVDRALLVDNPAGVVSVAGSRLDASSRNGVGGSVTLTGQQVFVDGASSLVATGAAGGGLIQVGGSWQNSNKDVRQAIKAWVGSGALLDASATLRGDGGEIVVWSDIRQPKSATLVSGTLHAKGGASGGDGGQIETSGYGLDVAGIQINTSARAGAAGLWLLDPADITITTVSGTSPTDLIAPNTTTNNATATINVADLVSALQTSDVTVSTAGSGSAVNGGRITVASPIASSTSKSLSLLSNAGIDLAASISLAGGNLTLDAGTASSNAIGLIGSAPIALGAGNLTIRQTGVTSSAPPFGSAGTATKNHYLGSITTSGTTNVELLSGASLVLAGPIAPATGSSGGSLVKDGDGSLLLLGTNAYSAGTVVNAGRLVVSSSASSLPSGSIGSGTLVLKNGATLSAYQPQGAPITLDRPITLDSGTITVDVPFSTYTNLVLSGSISGAGRIKVASDTSGRDLTLSGANTFSGGVQVLAGPNQNGRVRVASATALGTGSFSVIPESGSSGPGYGAAQLELAGNAPSSLAIANHIVIDVNTQLGINIATGKELTLSGVISGSFATSGLQMVGHNVSNYQSGTLVLTGLNTYQGKTSVSGGTVKINADAALGAAPSTVLANAIVMSRGGKLLATNDLTMNANRGIILSAQNVTASGIGGALGAENGKTMIYNGVIAEDTSSLPLVVEGAGLVKLGGANTYTGATQIKSGTLVIEKLQAAGPSSDQTKSSGFNIGNGAVLEFSVPSDSLNLLVSSPSSMQFAGSGTLRKTGGGAVEWKQGSAIFALNADALIDVQGGTLIGGSYGNENWSGNLGSLHVASGATFDGVEAAIKVRGLTGLGAVRTGFTTSSSYDPSMTIGVNTISSDSYLFGGTISNGINGPGRLVKVGAGTQVLTGSNSYSGTTTISGGVLQIGNGGGSTGTIGTASVLNNGTLRFHRDNDYTVSSVISGTGALEKAGTGTLALSSINSYVGDTRIHQGTL